jgi:colanic acid biosynthesis glycosyl transferase WcaI
VKILIVTQYFWPENFRINDLGESWVKQGHTVTVLTAIPNYPEGRFFHGYGFFKKNKEDYKGITVYRVPILPRGSKNHFRLAMNYLSFVISGLLLAPFYCRDNYDLIFVMQLSPITVALPAILIKKIKHIPMVLWVQDLWPESLSATKAVTFSPILKFMTRLVRYIYHRCDLILVQSQAFISSVKRFGVDMNHICYFPNSAEDYYRPVELSYDAVERKSIPKGFIVMFAGNIGVAQDFETIISAAAKIRDYKDIYWVIIGDGRMHSWVKEEIMRRDLSTNILLLGRHPAEMMPRYFALADVMLVSLKDDKNIALTIPSKVQSYLACAKPIIASLGGEGARIIEESMSGFSCQPENPDALAKLVLKMYHMEKAERQAMGINGRKYFENNFERGMLINRLDKIFKELLTVSL